MKGLLNTGADRVQRLYQSFQLTLVGLYAQALDQPAPTMPAVRQQTAHAALTAQAAFLTAARAVLEQSAGELITDALRQAGHSSTELSAQVATVVAEARTAVLANLAAASQHDVDLVAKKLRDFALRVNWLADATDLSTAAAVVRVKIEAGSAFNFEQLDRGRKKWRSSDYVRAVARHHLVSVAIETFLFGAARHGEDVVRLTADNTLHGTLISITGATPDLPAYHDIAAQVWHPNSNVFAERISHVPA